MEADSIVLVRGVILLGSHLAGKNGLKASIGREIQLPDAVWGKLTYYVGRFSDFLWVLPTGLCFTRFEAQWVNYKMFGSTALMLFFFIIQGIYLSTYLKKED
nr:septation protein IspZ [Neisseria gonorrhoeae]